MPLAKTHGSKLYLKQCHYTGQIKMRPHCCGLEKSVQKLQGTSAVLSWQDIGAGSLLRVIDILMVQVESQLRLVGLILLDYGRLQVEEGPLCDRTFISVKVSWFCILV